jgi:hypothetical protein
MDITGTNEDDFLAGTIGNDRIDAFDDDDTIGLGIISINNAVGTGISFNNDLIAVVEGVSISDFSSGFDFV